MPSNANEAGCLIPKEYQQFYEESTSTIIKAGNDVVVPYVLRLVVYIRADGELSRVPSLANEMDSLEYLTNISSEGPRADLPLTQSLQVVHLGDVLSNWLQAKAPSYQRMPEILSLIANGVDIIDTLSGIKNDYEVRGTIPCGSAKPYIPPKEEAVPNAKLDPVLQRVLASLKAKEPELLACAQKEGFKTPPSNEIGPENLAKIASELISKGKCVGIATDYIAGYKDLQRFWATIETKDKPPKPPQTPKKPPAPPKKESICNQPPTAKWGVRFSYLPSSASSTSGNCPTPSADAGVLSLGQQLSIDPSTVRTSTLIPDLGRVNGGFATPAKAEPLQNWYLTLLPAMQSVMPKQGGRDVPQAMPGMQVKVSNKIIKQAVPGMGPIYQNMGMESMTIVLVGCFTGDGGLEVIPPRMADIRGNGNPESGPAGNLTYDSNMPIRGRRTDPTLEEIQQKLLTPKTDPAQVSYGRMPMTYTIPYKESRADSLFLQDGCPGQCPPPGYYRDTYNHPKQLPASTKDPYSPYQDLGPYPNTGVTMLGHQAARLDAYQEFTSFYKIAYVEGHLLEIEVNTRRNRDGMSPQIDPFSPVENPLRDSGGNPKFKGYIKRLETYLQYSDRVWYTMEIEVTDLGLNQSKVPLNLTNLIKIPKKEDAKKDISSTPLKIVESKPNTTLTEAEAQAVKQSRIDWQGKVNKLVLNKDGRTAKDTQTEVVIWFNGACRTIIETIKGEKISVRPQDELYRDYDLNPAMTVISQRLISPENNIPKWVTPYAPEGYMAAQCGGLKLKQGSADPTKAYENEGSTTSDTTTPAEASPPTKQQSYREFMEMSTTKLAAWVEKTNSLMPESLIYDVEVYYATFMDACDKRTFKGLNKGAITTQPGTHSLLINGVLVSHVVTITIPHSKGGPDEFFYEVDAMPYQQMGIEEQPSGYKLATNCGYRG